MRHAIRHIYFVGIGGSGMSGIAEVLHHEGYQISGSDQQSGASIQRLKSLGICVFSQHDSSNITDVDCLVVSTAIAQDNPELLAARQAGIPIVARAVMLAELMRMKRGIAIAGTHGKTTTTSLTASVLAVAGWDPTFVIGGRLNSVGANAALGRGDYIVVEADESDASFLNLLPMIAVVTNIDSDHMETYGHDLERLKTAFLDFLHRMPFYGSAIVCLDDAGVQSIIPRIARPVITYGLAEDAQVRGVGVIAHEETMRFTAQRKGLHLPDLEVQLNLVGQHNVLNALAVIALASELEIPDAAIVQALAEFKGVGRRFQKYGDWVYRGRSFTLIDDYGHHPVELRAIIAAARGAYGARRLVLAFQPHRYTRTKDCFEDFVTVLGAADVSIVTEVYAAGEAPIVACDGRTLVRALRVAGKVEPVFVECIDDLPQVVLDMVQEGDVVICMGAGSIGHVPAKIQQIVEEGVHVATE